MVQDNLIIGIKKYFGIVHRRRYLAIALGILVLSVFTWGSFLWPKTYQASATVSIQGTSQVNPLEQDVRAANSARDTKLRNLTNEIKSRYIVEKAVKNLGLQGDDGKISTAFVNSVLNDVEVKVKGARGETDLFNIIYRGKDPKQVADLVNALTETYISEYVSTRREDKSETFDFIQSQLLEYKNRLEESDSQLRSFKEKNPTLVPRSETTLMGRMENINMSQMESSIKINELIRKRDNLLKQLSGEKELTVAFVTREGTPQARLNQLNNQLIILMGKYTDNYPEVVKVKREIEELKKQIAQLREDDLKGAGGSETASLNPVYQQLREELSKTEAEIESLKGRMSELSKQEQKLQHFFGLMPREQEEWTKLQRDRNVYQQIYDQLLQKLENARVSMELEQANKGNIFNVVDPAIVPVFPVSPDRFKMILFGIVLGIIAGIGIPLYIDYADGSFKDAETVEGTLKLPVLSTIPMIVFEDDRQVSEQLDRKVYIASGAYCALIMVVMVGEFFSRYLGINLINF
jgi:polysaccharide biosynthesis transport protein